MNHIWVEAISLNVTEGQFTFIEVSFFQAPSHFLTGILFPLRIGLIGTGEINEVAHSFSAQKPEGVSFLLILLLVNMRGCSGKLKNTLASLTRF